MRFHAWNKPLVAPMMDACTLDLDVLFVPKMLGLARACPVPVSDACWPLFFSGRLESFVRVNDNVWFLAIYRVCTCCLCSWSIVLPTWRVDASLTPVIISVYLMLSALPPARSSLPFRIFTLHECARDPESCPLTSLFWVFFCVWLLTVSPPCIHKTCINRTAVPSDRGNPHCASEILDSVKANVNWQWGLQDPLKRLPYTRTTGVELSIVPILLGCHHPEWSSADDSSLNEDMQRRWWQRCIFWRWPKRTRSEVCRSIVCIDLGEERWQMTTPECRRYCVLCHHAENPRSVVNM